MTHDRILVQLRPPKRGQHNSTTTTTTEGTDSSSSGSLVQSTMLSACASSSSAQRNASPAASWQQARLQAHASRAAAFAPSTPLARRYTHVHHMPVRSKVRAKRRGTVGTDLRATAGTADTQAETWEQQEQQPTRQSRWDRREPKTSPPPPPSSLHPRFLTKAPRPQAAGGPIHAKYSTGRRRRQ